MIYTINGLTEGARGVTIRVRILIKNQPKVVKTKDEKEHRVVDIEVGDRTGRILLSLWDERVDVVNEDDVIDIENGYVNKFKGKLRLNVGKFGNLDKVEAPRFPKANDLLTIHWRKYR
jgi:replication factor A1